MHRLRRRAPPHLDLCFAQSGAHRRAGDRETPRPRGVDLEHRLRLRHRLATRIVRNNAGEVVAVGFRGAERVAVAVDARVTLQQRRPVRATGLRREAERVSLRTRRVLPRDRRASIAGPRERAGHKKLTGLVGLPVAVIVDPVALDLRVAHHRGAAQAEERTRRQRVAGGATRRRPAELERRTGPGERRPGGGVAPTAHVRRALDGVFEPALALPSEHHLAALQPQPQTRIRRLRAGRDRGGDDDRRRQGRRQQGAVDGAGCGHRPFISNRGRPGQAGRTGF